MNRSQRSCLTSGATWPGRSLAAAPATFSYWKHPTRSSRASSSHSSRYSKSASVSPGNPTMKVERMAISGQIPRQARIRSSTFASLAGRRMARSTPGAACWNGMSR